MSYAGHVSPTSSRPRAETSHSFQSRKSSGSGNLVESHQEKEGKRLHTKADPSVAINEAEPAAVAINQASNISPIRSIQHRDAHGNPIADPDRSNPTRSRWERPLDTIRSFEAAIDGNYSNRKSMYRADVSDLASNHGGGGYNRRSSYYAGSQMGLDDRSRFPQNGYHNRPQPYRADSAYTPRPESYYNGGGGYDMSPNQSNGYQPQRARVPARTASEPFVNGPGFYPGPGYQQSYETVTTASGSGSSGEPAGYQTDPSSENSSVDRITALPGHFGGDNYGSNGFNGDAQYGQPGRGVNQPYNPAQRQGDGYLNQPAPPQRDAGPRVPIKLGNSNGSPVEVPPSAGEKRRSWFGRRFSRS